MYKDKTATRTMVCHMRTSIVVRTITQTITSTMGLTKCNNEPSQGENETWKNSTTEFVLRWVGRVGLSAKIRQWKEKT